jgi:Flp pilus assembly protein TadD
MIMTRAISLLIFLSLAISASGEPPAAPGLTLGPSTDLNAPGEKKAPDEAQKIAKRALAALAHGDLEGAKRDFLRVLQLAPDNVTTIINLGLVEYRQKNYPEAERLLTRAVRMHPENGLAWLLLGVIEHDQEKLDAALAALAQAVLWEPKNAMAHHYLGVTVGKKGWYSGAADEMRKAIELQPNYAEAHFNLAIFYLQEHPPAIELARRHYQKARDLGAAPDPDLEKQLNSPNP